MLLHLISIARDENALESRRERIHDPPIPTPKGRPRTARITGPLEGRRRGGGARNSNVFIRTDGRALAGNLNEVEDDELQDDSDRDLPPTKRPRKNKCGLCRQEGHNRQNCSWNR